MQLISYDVTIVIFIDIYYVIEIKTFAMKKIFHPSKTCFYKF